MNTRYANDISLSKSSTSTMHDTEFIFSLVFMLFSFCIVYPPAEFESLGLTIENVFSSYLGSVDIEFVQYQLHRTCLTLFVHTMLPLFYLLCYYLKFDSIIEYDAQHTLKFVCWNSFVIFALVMPVLSGLLITYWRRNDYAKHPLVENLRKYNQESWQRASVDINSEYRRNDKIFIRNSTVSSIIATENWIIKTTNYQVQLAHQSDTALIAIQSDSHNISEASTDAVQYVNIRVKPTRQGVSEFLIRINALDFRLLQDRMHRPITILDGVKFNKTVIDRFVEVFRQHVQLNPTYTPTEEVTEMCFACTQVLPNVKLQKMCPSTPNSSASNECTNCYCRPMFCVDCMGQWFASRQNQDEKDRWLEQKCTCPVCRAKFCMLDVCLTDVQ